MKTYLLAALLLFSVGAFAQSSTHSDTLNWTASADQSGNPTLIYNVYRASGPCPASGSPTLLSKIGSTLAAITTYTDSAVSTAQSYCYVVRASLNGIESKDSNAVGAVIPLAPAVNLAVTAQ